MLVRQRVAEIGEDPVAHILGDIAPQPGNHLGHGGLISPEHLAQIFRIEARRQRGRANQIAKHDSQLPTLGTGRGIVGCRRHGGMALGVERDDGV